MVDPATLAALGGSAALVAKILGPTAEYLGEGLRYWAEARVNNLERIFGNAEGKLGTRLSTTGGVSPRVLKEILQDGSYAGDPLGVEYYGGILASSRNETGTDDRGAAWARMTSGLSTYALRAHFVWYAVMSAAFRSESMGTTIELQRLRVWISHEEFLLALGFAPKDHDSDLAKAVASHVFFSLHQFDLLGGSSWSARVLRHGELGTVAGPSAPGAELFIWALGIGEGHGFWFLPEAGPYVPEIEGIVLPVGFIATTTDQVEDMTNR